MALTVGELVAYLKVDAGNSTQVLSGVGSAMGKVEAAARNVEKAQISLSQAQNKAEAAAQRVAKAEADLARVRASGKATVDQVAKAEAALERAKTAQAGASLRSQKAEVDMAAARQKASAAATAAASAVDKAKAATDALTPSLEKTTGATGKLSAGLDKLGKHEASINTLSNQAGALGLAVTGMAVLSVKKFADFDQSMSNVAASGQDARNSIDELREAAIQAGADTAFSATESADAVTELAKAGVTARDILGGGLAGSLDLAAAGALGVAEAAEITSTVMNQFSLSGDQATRIADVLAATATKANGEVADFGLAMKYVGPVAAQLGISLEETSGTLALFAQNGLLADTAGTGLRGVLMSLTAPTKEAQKTLDEYGISAFDAQGQFVGLTSLAGQLQSQLGGLTEAERSAALGRIFGNQQITAARILYSEGAGAIEEWTEAVGEQGFAATVAATKMDNLKGDLEQLGGSLETFFIGVGDGGNGPLRWLVQTLDGVVDSLNDLPAPAKNALLAIAGGGGLALLGVAAMGKLTTSVVAGRDAMVSLGMVTPTTAGKMGSLARASAKVAGTATAIAAVASATGAILESLRSGEEIPGANELAASIRDIAASGGDIDDLGGQFDNFGEILGISTNKTDTLSEAFDKLLSPSTADRISGFVDGIPGVTGYMEKLDERVRDLDTSLASMIAAGEVEAVEAFQNALIAEGYTLEQINELLPETKDALIGVAEATGQAAGEAGAAAPEQQALADAFAQQAEAAEDAWEAQLALAEGMLGLRDAERGFEAALDAVDEAVKKNGATLDIRTAKGRDNAAVLDDIADKGWAMIDQMRSQGASEEELQAAMGRTRKAYILAADEMGETRAEARLLADSINLIPDNVSVKVSANTDEASRAISGFLRQYPMVAVNGKAVVDFFALGRGAPSPSSPLQRAAGGSVAGPGTETSDSIHALLSNNEHIWTADEVRGAGGHTAVEHMRQMAKARTLPRFATGGRVEWAQDRSAAHQARVVRYRDAVLDRRKDVRGAESDVRSAEKALSAAKKNGSKAAIAREERDVRAAKKALEAEKKKLERAEKDLARVRDVRDDVNARTERLQESTRDLQVDVRRGDSLDQITSGLSGGLSVVDQMREASRNTDLSARQRKALAAGAWNAEKELTKQYAALEKNTAELEKQRGIADELRQIHDQVAGRLSGEQSLGASLGQKDEWGYDKPVTAQSLVADARARASKIKDFGSRLNQLRAMGLSGAILQEVAMLGSDQGMQVADALIAGGKGQTNALNAAYADIAKYSSTAGQYVTEAFRAGGLSAADGIVKGLEQKRGVINAAVLTVANDMIKTFKGAWGIASPAKEAISMMGHIADGFVLGGERELPKAQAIARKYGDALMPDSTLAARTISSGSGAASSGLVGLRDELVGAVRSALPEALMGMPIHIAAEVGVDRRTAARIVQVGEEEGRYLGGQS